MADLFSPISLIIALSYVLGIRIFKNVAFKIFYSIVFTVILLIQFPIREELKLNNLITSSYITFFAMLGPLLINLYKYLKFRDFEYFYEKQCIYTLIHCLLTGPICEELIFRHAIYQISKINLVQAFTFAIVHFSLSNFKKSILQVGFTFIFGLWAGIIKKRCGIEGCILSHLICNWIGFPDVEFFLALDKKEVVIILLLQAISISIAIKELFYRV